MADDGLKLLSLLREGGAHPNVIFFVGDLDPERGVPPGAFGITNSGEELLHLVFDVVERERF